MESNDEVREALRLSHLAFSNRNIVRARLKRPLLFWNRYISLKRYPSHLRRIRFHDAETDKHLVFLTNQFNLPAATICALYKSRWQVEQFIKWIKQHLRIKVFYGTGENEVKTQIWIAVSV